MVSLSNHAPYSRLLESSLEPRMTPEEQAREQIDRMLTESGWVVQDYKAIDLYAGRGVAVREFVLKDGHGRADYLLYLDRIAVGVVEAKPAGHTLAGVETQTDKYSDGLPDELPYYRKPLPYLYQSTGVETCFTNLYDPDPRSRPLFSFHRPETMAEWLSVDDNDAVPELHEPRSPYVTTFALAMQNKMPPLQTQGLWGAQIEAIRNIERSLTRGDPRLLVQMATGSGKTRMACALAYRLIKYASARRILFLVDRSNLARQTLREFQGYDTPDDGRKFTEIYNVQHLRSDRIDPVSRVCISTIQRVYSILKGESLDEDLEEMSTYEAAMLQGPQATVEYNPRVPIEEFDIIITDEAHRSIYNLWRQVLEYFDARLIGLTATPSKQTIGFFRQNLVMEYGHEQAVADGVNVDFDVYRIRTQITEHGSTVDAGYFVDKRDRETRKVRWEKLDDDLDYGASELDREVVADDQIRTVLQTFRDKALPDMFPDRDVPPKTLIFAKDDSHAEDIVRIARDVFGKGNDFCQKITYKTTGAKPEDLLKQFCNSVMPRVAVTVDMIATGTDVRPLEVVFFMRNVRSRTFFEQMKGRGVRVISSTEFRSVTPGAKENANKERFVIVDAVGVTEADLNDNFTLNKQPSVSLSTLMDAVAKGNRQPETLTTLASRLARLDKQLTAPDHALIEEASGGTPLAAITAALVEACGPDAPLERAQAETGLETPPPDAVEAAARQMREEAAKPLASNPGLRQVLLDIRKLYEQTIDTVSADALIEAGPSAEATERARNTVASFRQFIEEHRDEITALQILYERPYARPITYEELRELANALQAPPRSWTTQRLWDAYRQVEQSKVRGSVKSALTDIISLVRHATGEDDELAPFADRVHANFERWMAMQEIAHGAFTDEQRRWLEAIRDHVAGNGSMEVADFQYAPFNQQGGLGKAYQLFGDELAALLGEMNGALAG